MSSFLHLLLFHFRVVNFYFLYAIIGTRSMGGYAYCPESALAPLPFVLEYVLWRGWHQAVIYTPEFEQGMSYISKWYIIFNNVIVIFCLGNACLTPFIRYFVYVAYFAQTLYICYSNEYRNIFNIGLFKKCNKMTKKNYT